MNDEHCCLQACNNKMYLIIVNFIIEESGGVGGSCRLSGSNSSSGSDVRRPYFSYREYVARLSRIAINEQKK
jgi:hypothetical protein